MGCQQVGPFVAQPDGLQTQCLGTELVDDMNQACKYQSHPPGVSEQDM